MKKLLDIIKNFFEKINKKKHFVCANCKKLCKTSSAIKVKDKHYYGYYDENVSEKTITICKDCYSLRTKRS